MEQGQAQVIAEAIHQRGEDYATKADIADVPADISDVRADISRLETRLIPAAIGIAALAVTISKLIPG